MKSHLLSAAVFAVLIGAFVLVATDGKLPWVKPPDRGPGWCTAHEVELAKCEVCNPALARGGTKMERLREPKPGECPNTLVVIELGPGAAEAVGLQTAEVRNSPIAETIRGTGETQWPPGKLARLAPRIAGIIREVKAGLGEQVAAGAPLAVLECQDLAQAKSTYRQSLAALELRVKTYDQEKALFDKRIASGRELLEAETTREEARLTVAAAGQALRGLGLTDEQIEAVGKGDLTPFLVITAPFEGSVVETSAVIGESAFPDRPIFSVAGLERMWVAIDVYESDLPRVSVGQKVAFHVEGLTGQRFNGKVAAIAGEMDDRTRTIRVYADVKNPDGLLRARMYGRAEISVKEAEPRLLVPREAVQNDGDCDLVFVVAGKKYQARAVTLGTAYEGGFEVKGGLSDGERVVTKGSFLLKTEVLRGQMGAG